MGWRLGLRTACFECAPLSLDILVWYGKRGYALTQTEVLCIHTGDGRKYGVQTRREGNYMRVCVSNKRATEHEMSVASVK